jgi:hypothetical protein
MRNLNLGGYVLACCVAAAILAGCGGSAPPIAAPGATTQSRAAATHADNGGSWMAPDATKQDLLYVSDWGTGDVYAYSYPKRKLQGKLTGLMPTGLCVDKKGDVFVDNSREMLEYAHGGTSPIATLDDSGAYPTVCSIDRVTGDLAVANRGDKKGISIFTHARGRPTIYVDPKIEVVYFCGYDNHGNLYLDGFGPRGSRFAFAELPHGSHAFTEITLDQTIRWPGGVQWDGRYIAVADIGIKNRGSVIYHFAINGHHGTKVGSTPLGSSREVLQFWIDPPNVIGPDNGGDYGSAVKFWAYPAGGAPKRSLQGFDSPWGATVSKAR